MNDAILSLIIASATGLLTLCVRYAYFSKCDVIEICGCCRIHRQIINESNQPDNNEISIAVREPNTPTVKNIGEQKSFRM